jgi:hypothetical protein
MEGKWQKWQHAPGFGIFSSLLAISATIGPSSAACCFVV